MDADPSLAAFAVAVDRPDDQIHLAHAALLIAAAEARPRRGLEPRRPRATPSRPGAPTTPSGVSTGSGSISSRSWASRETATTTSIRATAI
jgi:hypothetical protein